MARADVGLGWADRGLELRRCEPIGLHRHALHRRPARELWVPHLGFGRVVASETKPPNISVKLVWRGWARIQSGDTTEP